MQILVDAHLTNTYFYLANSHFTFMIRIVISSFSQNYKRDIYRQR